MKGVRGQNPGRAFGFVEPDDDPMARCSDGHKYNPYEYQDCPHC